MMSERAYYYLSHLPRSRIDGEKPFFFKKEWEWVCVGRGGFATGVTWQAARAMWEAGIERRRQREERDVRLEQEFSERVRVTAQHREENLADQRRIRAIKEEARAHKAMRRPHMRTATRERHAWPEFGGGGPELEIPLRDHNGDIRYMPLHAYLDSHEVMQ